MKKSFKGSILAYSLILLGIVLIASIGMMSASITNLRSVSTNDASLNAFQIADSAAQIVVTKLRNPGPVTGDRIRDYWPSSSEPSCANSTSSLDDDLLQGQYRVTFYGDDGVKLSCNDNVSLITSVKSVGTYKDTVRAVQIAVLSSPVLVGYWKLDESSGRDASDFSGYGNGGEWNNDIDWSSGEHAPYFDGTNDDVVRIDNDISLDMRREISISLWFRVEAFTGEWAPLVSKMDDTGSVGSRTYLVRLNSNGSLHLASAGASGQTVVNTNPGSVSIDQWYHYVGIIDRNAGVMKSFLNGSMDPSTSVNVETRNTVSHESPVRVGGKFGTYSNFQGLIDDVRIYNGALSEDDVKDLYDNGNGRPSI